MKYFRQYYNDTEKKEIGYEEALNLVLGSYKDNDMTRDMLTIPNRINLMFGSTLTVENDDGMVLAAGLYNQIPNEFGYDDEGNHRQPPNLKPTDVEIERE